MLSSYRTESLEANREQEAEVLHTTDSPGGLEARILDTADSPGGFEDGSPQTAVTTGMITTKDHKYIELDLQRLSSVSLGLTSSQWEPEPSRWKIPTSLTVSPVYKLY